jgi:hypothetical protein
MKVVFAMCIFESRQVHQLFSEKKARELGTADNLETTSDLLSFKIQKAKGSKFF